MHLGDALRTAHECLSSSGAEHSCRLTGVEAGKILGGRVDSTAMFAPGHEEYCSKQSIQEPSADPLESARKKGRSNTDGLQSTPW